MKQLQYFYIQIIENNLVGSLPQSIEGVFFNQGLRFPWQWRYKSKCSWLWCCV